MLRGMGDRCIVGHGGFEYPGELQTFWTTEWGDAVVAIARSAKASPSLQLACFADGDELERPGDFPSAPIGSGESARSAFAKFIAQAKKSGRRRTLSRLGFDVSEVDLGEVDLDITGRVQCELDGQTLAVLADDVLQNLRAASRSALPDRPWRRVWQDHPLVHRVMSELAKRKRYKSHLALAVIAHAARNGLRKMGIEEDEPSWEDSL
jgi:hypothetical protein